MVNGRSPSPPKRSPLKPAAALTPPAASRTPLAASAVLLLALCVVAAAAQVASGVEVVGFGWKYEGYVPTEVVRNKKSGHTLSVKRGTAYVFKYRAQATLRNGGAKAVKAIEWDYVFAEPEGGKELKRYRLQSKQAVAPGATQTLSKDVFIQPDEDTRHITRGRQQVIVTRVEYDDGSVWKAKE